MIWATLPKSLKIALPVLALVSIMLIVAALWPEDKTAQEQAVQTTRSAEAISQAAEQAIERIGDNVATEEKITAESRQAAEEIDSAQNSEAIREAVLKALCPRASHANDPACATRQRVQ